MREPLNLLGDLVSCMRYYSYCSPSHDFYLILRLKSIYIFSTKSLSYDPLHICVYDDEDFQMRPLINIFEQVLNLNYET